MESFQIDNPLQVYSISSSTFFSYFFLFFLLQYPDYISLYSCIYSTLDINNSTNSSSNPSKLIILARYIPFHHLYFSPIFSYFSCCNILYILAPNSHSGVKVELSLARQINLSISADRSKLKSVSHH